MRMIIAAHTNKTLLALMLFKCDSMFREISKGVWYELNSVHQGKNRRKPKMQKMGRKIVEIQ
jgi:hypothetical protein